VKKKNEEKKKNRGPTSVHFLRTGGGKAAVGSRLPRNQKVGQTEAPLEQRPASIEKRRKTPNNRAKKETDLHQKPNVH